ncbi:hypothetical protein [Streptomyces sp900105755]|uniref:ATP-binding protein n=1 Tax=Streptomyces sp. 900105755 TaxID=3154389 RepID=A0ABV1TXR2_9ACTN
MRPVKRAHVGWPPALRELKELLYQVYLAAGAPSLNEIAEDIVGDDGLVGSPSRDTVHRAITDGERPGQQADVVAVATVLARRAAWDVPDLAGRVRDLWMRAFMARGAGRPIGDLRGDVRLVLDGGLGVHPALDIGGASDRFGTLPAYIRRDHDARLKSVVDAAKARRSGIAVLVGGSSTGKTRALWEAVEKLPDGWRLWHPLSPTAPEAILDALADIAPKTVVWLNEAQFYLEPDALGEQVAAGLRELLHDPSRAPVLVLGTLWPGHWDTLTTRTTPDRHAGARELLGGHKIDVPDAFTPADLVALDAGDDVDPRLVQAAQHAKGAQVTQYLAGVPYLLDRYDAARGATLALIHAAMDARRMGAGPHLPLDWLAAAAPGYLDDDEYHSLERDWLSKALAYVTTPCNGIPGILTPITSNGLRNQRTRRRLEAGGVPAGRPAPSLQGPRYLLADYLDQHGRHHRAETIPPIEFWTAAGHYAHPTDLTELGDAAWNRGLYRDAAQLHKRATTHGNPRAAVTLVRHLRALHPTDHQPAQWAAAHAAVDDPGAVAWVLNELRVGAHEQIIALLARGPAAHAAVWLLNELREVGAHEQITALLARGPAAHAAVDDPRAVIWLLQELREVGAHEQVTALAERAAVHAVLDNPQSVAKLLKELRGAGAHEQITALLARDPAVHAALDDPPSVAELLKELRGAGAHEQITALLARDPAARVALDDRHSVAGLLQVLRDVGAHEQVTALAERAAAHAALDNPFSVAGLLQVLRDVGAHEQVTALAERAAAHAVLDNPQFVAELLGVLREAGAHEQVTALLARDPAAHVALDRPHSVVWLLQVLQDVGAHEQVTPLAERAAAHAILDDPYAVGELLQMLQMLQEAGAHEQVTALLARDPAARAALDDPPSVAKLLKELRDVGAHEQVTALAERAAAHAALDNPHSVVWLLKELRDVGAHEQVTALAERAAAHAALDNPSAVAGLLQELWGVGTHEQVTALLARDPAAHVALDYPPSVAKLLKVLREAGAHEQVIALAERAAVHAAVDISSVVGGLLEVLRDLGAQEQVAALTERLPAAGHFDRFIELGGNRERFRLGREPDGSVAPSWTWNDLD